MATYPTNLPNASISMLKPLFNHYNPNDGRSSTYPNKWTLDTKIKTGRCRLCQLKFAKCGYNIRCDECNMHICQICWEGRQLTTAGEKRFEGEFMNESGCWCRNGGVPPPGAMVMMDARTIKIKEFMAAQEETKREAALVEVGDSEDESPAKKRHELFEEDGDDEDSEDPDAAEYDQDLAVSTTPTSKATAEFSPPAVKHLQNKTTVIIGAGVVGLSIAYDLALHTMESGTKHTVVVVEARSGPAQLASGSCAGLITTSAVPPELTELSDLSKECWAELLVDDGAPEAFHHDYNGVLSVNDPDKKRVMVPEWLNAGLGKSFSVANNEVGKISTPDFANWLYEQCLELDVQFYFNSQVSTFDKRGFEGRILRVDITNAVVDAKNEEVQTIECDNIVIAAGAWTSGIVAELLPWASFSVASYLQRYEHIRLPHHDLASEDDLGVVFGPDQGGVLFSAQAEREEIIAATVISTFENKPLTIDQALDNNPPYNTKTLQQAAKRYLTAYDETNMVKARSWISTATEPGLPIIDKIPAVKVDERFDGEKESPLGIWLCYGFGRHGTTLAPGVARALRRRICGEESGIGDAVCAAFV